MKKRTIIAAALMTAAAMGMYMSAMAAGIDIDEAKKTALEAVGLTEDDVIFKQAEKDADDGRTIIEIDFFVPGEVKYEYDFDEAHDNIRQDSTGRYRVKAQTEIEDFNATFGTAYSDDDFDTVGGLVLRHLGRVPKRNEVIEIDHLRFQVLRADSRRLYTLLVDITTSAAA